MRGRLLHACFTKNDLMYLAQGMTKEKKVYLHFSAVGLCVLGCVLLNLTILAVIIPIVVPVRMKLFIVENNSCHKKQEIVIVVMAIIV